VIEISASGTIEIRVSLGLIAIMNPRAISATVRVFTTCMTPGPSIIRTEARSLVARDMISPVRTCWKYWTGWRWRCANRSLRRSYSRWREIPITDWRIA